MDTNYILFRLGGLQMLETALPDATREAERYFQDHEYTPQAADAWCATRREMAPHWFGVYEPPVVKQLAWERHNMTKEQWDKLPLTERLTRGRMGQEPVVKSGREHPRPPVDLAEQWNTLPPIPRLTAKREWEAAQLKQREAVVDVKRVPDLRLWHRADAGRLDLILLGRRGGA